MTELTRILSAVEQGDTHAARQLLPLVYDELRKLAAARLARESGPRTLDATSLVHEAYLRLMAGPLREQGEEPAFANRAHFFAAAAEAMRRILVENARRKGARKRGGGRKRAEIHESAVAALEDSDEVLAVDEALAGLAAEDPKAAELVKLRYFVGLPIAEAAQVLNIPPRSADRLWAYSRAWLRRAISAS
jgi:RNA polymerase sigma factor (TIGR02999 family)